jgi:hypothetical protein
LHFYVIDLEKDTQGIRTYTLGVRALEGAGPHERGVELAAPAGRNESAVESYNFTLKNTGRANAIDAALHLQDVAPYVNSDIYRLSVAVEGAGWTAQLQNALASLRFGESNAVQVFVTRGTAPTATLRLTATSESDPSKTATSTYTIGR